MSRKSPRDDDSGEPGESKDLVRREEGAVEPARPQLEASLEFLSGPAKGRTVVLTRIVTLIGRQDTCDVVLDDETASREHGQIEQTLGRWVYTNFSENGTWINRKRAERVELSDGDTVEMGANTRMRFALKEPKAVEVGPLVRRRPRKSRDAADEAEAEEQDEARPTIADALKQRRKLVVGLGIYLGLLVVGAVVVAAMMSDGGNTSRDSSGTEWRRRDIKNWLDSLKTGVSRDPTMANRRMNDALRYYQHAGYGSEMELFSAIWAWQEAIDYSGRSLLPDYDHQQMFTEAKKRLADQLWALYKDALMAESQRDRRKGRRLYNEIMRRIPSDNDFYRHCLRRQSRL